ncbi:AraC family transcriptional regulator [Thalassospira mesophila]|uniref:HTH araC/xylS-type domain-containing protein n=1 Tax=Thalassospira mesophila TaxID=1293891 RepID=A0A1Y2L319_9PROT|nr:AraC family transcriptional regulator [Thalassospira mesophila]OSQ39604.1 hypothetical protein TMES_06265 [Thalassospira mesophila]
MTPADKAVWLIETHIEDDAETSPDLALIAEKCGVSSRHLLRAFAAATGMSVMRYARARKLSVAAQKLVAKDLRHKSILTLALDAGYASHEAFSRAFRDCFGLSPEDLRARGHLENLTLQECLRMSEQMIVNLEQPRFEKHGKLRIAGLRRGYSIETSTAIPAQWQQFIPWIGAIDGQAGTETFGVCTKADPATPSATANIKNSESNESSCFDYICGVAINDAASITDPELSVIEIAPQNYVVFTHRGHISGIRATIHTIWNQYLPKSGLKLISAPDFERYSPDFNPDANTGTVEIWIPANPA